MEELQKTLKEQGGFESVEIETNSKNNTIKDNISKSVVSQQQKEQTTAKLLTSSSTSKKGQSNPQIITSKKQSTALLNTSNSRVLSFNQPTHTLPDYGTSANAPVMSHMSKFFDLNSKGNSVLQLRGGESSTSSSTGAQSSGFGNSQQLDSTNVMDGGFGQSLGLGKNSKKIKSQNKQSSQSNQKIPMIHEWFESLSMEQRKLCLTSIDKGITWSIQEMTKKIRKNGEGIFKLVKKGSAQIPGVQIPSSSYSQSSQKQTSLFDKNKSSTSSHLSQYNKPKKLSEQLIDLSTFSGFQQYEFSYKSSKQIQKYLEADGFSDQKKEEMLKAQVAEKEILENMKITESDEQFDTLTCTYDLVQDPQKLYQLCKNIVGDNFLIVPIQVGMKSDGQFHTNLPVWFDIEQFNSLGKWLVLYIERAMWIQYNYAIKGSILLEKDRVFANKDSENAPIFKETHEYIINLYEKLLPFMLDYMKQLQDDKEVKYNFLTDLMKSLYDHYKVNETSILSGGGIDFSKSRDPKKDAIITSLDQHKANLEALFEKNITAETFLQNIGMTSILDVTDNVKITFEKHLLDLVQEKYDEYVKRQYSSKNKKLLKKKERKKRIKLLEEQSKRQQEQQNELIKLQNKEIQDIEKQVHNTTTATNKEATTIAQDSIQSGIESLLQKQEQKEQTQTKQQAQIPSTISSKSADKLTEVSMPQNPYGVPSFSSNFKYPKNVIDGEAQLKEIAKIEERRESQIRDYINTYQSSPQYIKKFEETNNEKDMSNWSQIKKLGSLAEGKAQLKQISFRREKHSDLVNELMQFSDDDQKTLLDPTVIPNKITELPEKRLKGIVEYFAYEAESDREYDLLQSMSDSDSEDEIQTKQPTPNKSKKSLPQEESKTPSKKKSQLPNTTTSISNKQSLPKDNHQDPQSTSKKSTQQQQQQITSSSQTSTKLQLQQQSPMKKSETTTSNALLQSQQEITNETTQQISTSTKKQSSKKSKKNNASKDILQSTAQQVQQDTSVILPQQSTQQNIGKKSQSMVVSGSSNAGNSESTTIKNNKDNEKSSKNNHVGQQQLQQQQESSPVVNKFEVIRDNDSFVPATTILSKNKRNKKRKGNQGGANQNITKQTSANPSIGSKTNYSGSQVNSKAKTDQLNRFIQQQQMNDYSPLRTFDHKDHGSTAASGGKGSKNSQQVSASKSKQSSKAQTSGTEKQSKKTSGQQEASSKKTKSNPETVNVTNTSSQQSSTKQSTSQASSYVVKQTTISSTLSLSSKKEDPTPDPKQQPSSLKKQPSLSTTTTTSNQPSSSSKPSSQTQLQSSAKKPSQDPSKSVGTHLITPTSTIQPSSTTNTSKPSTTSTVPTTDQKSTLQNITSSNTNTQAGTSNTMQQKDSTQPNQSQSTSTTTTQQIYVKKGQQQPQNSSYQQVLQQVKQSSAGKEDTLNQTTDGQFSVQKPLTQQLLSQDSNHSSQSSNDLQQSLKKHTQGKVNRTHSQDKRINQASEQNYENLQQHGVIMIQDNIAQSDIHYTKEEEQLIEKEVENLGRHLSVNKGSIENKSRFSKDSKNKWDYSSTQGNSTGKFKTSKNSNSNQNLSKKLQYQAKNQKKSLNNEDKRSIMSPSYDNLSSQGLNTFNNQFTSSSDPFQNANALWSTYQNQTGGHSFLPGANIIDQFDQNSNGLSGVSGGQPQFGPTQGVDPQSHSISVEMVQNLLSQFFNQYGPGQGQPQYDQQPQQKDQMQQQTFSTNQAGIQGQQNSQISTSSSPFNFKGKSGKHSSGQQLQQQDQSTLNTSKLQTSKPQKILSPILVQNSGGNNANSSFQTSPKNNIVFNERNLQTAGGALGQQQTPQSLPGYSTPGISSIMVTTTQQRRLEEFYERLETMIQRQLDEINSKLQGVEQERQEAINEVRRIVKEVYEEKSAGQGGGESSCDVLMYGSMANGLAIDTSDVDLIVTGVGARQMSGGRTYLLRMMDKLHLNLQKQISQNTVSGPGLKPNGLFQEVNFIDTSMIPVIKLRANLQYLSEPQKVVEMDMQTLHIDITFEERLEQSTFGPSSLQSQSSNQKGNDDQEFTDQALAQSSLDLNQGYQCIGRIKELQNEFKELKPIVLIIKKLLHFHNLNNSYKGGMASYSIVIMTYSILQLRQQQTTPPKKSLLAYSLLDFLNFYGNIFNPSLTGIDENGKLFTLTPTHQAQFNLQGRLPGQTIPVILDLLDQFNNTAKSSYRFFFVQTMFKVAYHFLIDKLTVFCNQQSNSGLPNDSGMQDKILENLVSEMIDYCNQWASENQQSLNNPGHMTQPTTNPPQLQFITQQSQQSSQSGVTAPLLLQPQLSAPNHQIAQLDAALSQQVPQQQYKTSGIDLSLLEMKLQNSISFNPHSQTGSQQQVMQKAQSVQIQPTGSNQTFGEISEQQKESSSSFCDQDQ